MSDTVKGLFIVSTTYQQPIYKTCDIQGSKMDTLLYIEYQGIRDEKKDKMFIE